MSSLVHFLFAKMGPKIRSMFGSISAPFGLLFGGSPTAGIEFLLGQEPHFHFFREFYFSLILLSVSEPCWGPNSPLYSFLGFLA